MGYNEFFFMIVRAAEVLIFIYREVQGEPNLNPLHILWLYSPIVLYNILVMFGIQALTFM